MTRADNSYEEARVLFPFGGVYWQGGGCNDVRFASMQERDSQTTTWQNPLDWTPNRTYGENMSRWFSPDPPGGDVSNPQSLNRYAYVMNNPTTLTDRQGLSADFKLYDPATCDNIMCPGPGLLTGGADGTTVFGNDIFDAISGTPGTYLTHDMYGNVGFGFSVDLWRQTYAVAQALSSANVAQRLPRGYGGGLLGYASLNFGAITGFVTIVHDNGVFTEITGPIPDVYAATEDYREFNATANEADLSRMFALIRYAGTDAARSALPGLYGDYSSTFNRVEGAWLEVIAVLKGTGTVVYKPVPSPH